MKEYYEQQIEAIKIRIERSTVASEREAYKEVLSNYELMLKQHVSLRG